MRFINQFILPSDIDEEDFFQDQNLTCYDSYYPYRVFYGRGFEELFFSDITIIYGGNGSGKSTLLNIIADTIGAERIAPYNRSEFFLSYIKGCKYAMVEKPENTAFVASDDVFDYMLDIRNLNEGINDKRKERLAEYAEYKYSDFKFQSLDQLDELRLRNRARRGSKSRYVRDSLMDNVREYSNGETALRYFYEHIGENGLYLLDEPENSMSPKRQKELVRFIEDLARFFKCQFIISTHSPFVLSMKDALIYDLDQNPVKQADWRSLENVQEYYSFFKEHVEELEAFSKSRNECK